MTPLCFIDCETTSLRRDRRVWEVAMIRRDENGAKEATLIVLDVDLTEADPMSLRIGGFHHRHPRYGPRVLEEREFDLDEAAVARFVEEWTRGAHLVGAVPHFDAEVLSDMLRRHGLCPAWHYHLIDVEAMAVGYLHAAMPATAAEVIEQANALGYATNSELARDLGIEDSTVGRWRREGIQPSLEHLQRFRALVRSTVPTLPWRSDDLSRAVGVKPPGPDERHTAMGDAQWALRWYDAITGGAK